METRCTPLGKLTPHSRSWYTKALTIEKTPVRQRFGGRQQKLVLVDQENTKIQCTVYEQDVDQLDKVLQLYHTYYIGGGKIRETGAGFAPMVNAQYQMILSKNSYIKETPKEHELPLQNVYELTPFAQFSDFTDISNNRINILCAVIHVFPPRSTSRGKTLQEFVVVNGERRPTILTLWDDFAQVDALKLIDAVHNRPVILCMRLSVNTFHGLSLSTTESSVILFEPPISEAEHLQLWLKAEDKYLDDVISRELYRKEHQIIGRPPPSQIRKISQITSLHEPVERFWIKGQLKIEDPDQAFYIMECPNCSKSCGATYGTEFPCLHCNQTFPSPKAILRFEVELSDGSGNMTAFIEQKDAETLLGMAAEDIIKIEENGEKFDITRVNRKMKNIESLYHLRSYSFKLKGQPVTRYTIITWLSDSMIPSSSQSVEENIGPATTADKIGLKAQTPEEEPFPSSSSKRKLEPTSTIVDTTTKRTKEG